MGDASSHGDERRVFAGALSGPVAAGPGDDLCDPFAVAARIDEIQIDLGEGPCWEALRTRRILQQRLTEESLLAQAQLQRALDSRVVIEQAKGYIAQSHGLDMDAAFQRIRSYARNSQCRLSDVAADIAAGRLTI